MRKIFLLLAFMIAALPAFGQVSTTSVSGTISDANGQAFVSGTWSAVLIAQSGGTGQPFVCNGITLNSSQVQQSGNLDSSGAFTATMVSNSCISPSGSLWQFTFNPAATSAPYTQSVFIFGSTQSLTSTITPPAIVVNNSAVFTIAYTDAEVFGFKEGSFYWNVLTPALRVYHSGSWTTVGGGGGGGTPCTTTALSIQYNNAGAFGCEPDLTFTAPHALALGASGVYTITGTESLSGAAGWTIPTSAGFVSSSTLNMGIDSTSDNLHCWNGTADLFCLGISSAPTNGHVLGALVVSGNIKAQDLGPAAGGGSSFLECTPNGLANGDYFGISAGICQELIPGLTPVNIMASGSTTLLSSYRGQLVKASSTSGAQTFALPDGTTTGFQNNYYFALENHSTVGALTLTNNGGVYTFNGSASPFSLPEGTWCNVSNNSTSTGWTLDCSPGLLSAGSGVTLTPTQFGTQVSATGGGSGTVNSGTANQVTYYASTGTAVSGDSRLTDSGTQLAYTGTGGVAVGSSPPAITAGTSGAVSLGEGTAPTGVSGADTSYGNSTSHCLDIINQTTDIGCVAGLSAAQTFAGATTFSAANALSTPPVNITGAWLTSGGSVTTTTPQLYLNAGTAPSSWSTSGTGIGINAPSGFVGSYIDVHLNGGGSIFSVGSGGNLSATNVTATSLIVGTTGYRIASKLIISATAPTIGTCGTSPSIVASNGTAAFTVNVGTGGTASTCTVNMPAATTTGWSCMVAPNGAPQAAAVTYSAPTSTTLITLTNYTQSTGVALAWTSGTVLNVNCVGY